MTIRRRQVSEKIRVAKSRLACLMGAYTGQSTHVSVHKTTDLIH